jgi:alpha-galactosidase
MLLRLLAIAFVLAISNAAPAAEKKPLRVFVLAGQSNMEGHGAVKADPKRNGGKGSLEFVAKDPTTAARFKHLVAADGSWEARDDVYITYLERKGKLVAGFGVKEDRIGPELGFGCVVGDQLNEPVLLIKCAWGGKSLAVDFRPPSAGKPTYTLSEPLAAEFAKNPPEAVGKYYRQTLDLTRDALANYAKLFPELADYEPVLSGFFWHQGWNDRINEQFNKEYQSNMAHFIRDMRRDLKAPNLPFVIAETGMTGPTETHPRALSLMKAQAAVAEEAEFRGNVAFVATRNFWHPAEESPSNQGYHWNSNAETYYRIGEASGHAMLKLLGGPEKK